MSYTPEMRESIRKVEATRQRRLKETHPRMPPKEQEEILKRFHPDYVEGGMRELLVGPNRGDRTPNELADLLEGRSHIDAAAFDLERVERV